MIGGLNQRPDVGSGPGALLWDLKPELPRLPIGQPAVRFLLAPYRDDVPLRTGCALGGSNHADRGIRAACSHAVGVRCCAQIIRFWATWIPCAIERRGRRLLPMRPFGAALAASAAGFSADRSVR